MALLRRHSLIACIFGSKSKHRLSPHNKTTPVLARPSASADPKNACPRVGHGFVASPFLDCMHSGSESSSNPNTACPRVGIGKLLVTINSL